ncbi:MULTISPECIES: thiolase family protein [Comamonadaceae]|uniref:thiolase family protein n=1 Tax=Comamonadaceae TaxID=80864 RepID=UPI0010F4A7A7|nr:MULTISPECIES: thiolase family protein [Comamonadaceae]
MQDVYIVGAYTTPFKRHIDKSIRDLSREAYMGVLADAGMAKGDGIEFAWFGNCMADYWGQAVVRGQISFVPLVQEGLFPDRVPMINVEGGCATASMAFHGAWKDILSGQSDLSLAIGVEKLYDPEGGEEMLTRFSGGRAPFDREELFGEYRRIAGKIGRSFAPGPGRTLPMDTYAMQAAYHMHRWGTTREQIAYCASKNHFHGSLNPKAQYRFQMTPEEVLADRKVIDPLTRAMCSPIGDGAAAALLCSERHLQSVAPEVRARAVKIRASVFTGGKMRSEDEPSLSRVAAEKAYRKADVKPSDIDVAEVHDATSFGEIYQMEMLGFCRDGEGGPFVASGATRLGGAIPVNTSGGLVSKGHPLGATGLSMLAELATQLRGEAGERQVVNARLALQENGGGLLGLEEAACSVVILERN